MADDTGIAGVKLVSEGASGNKDAEILATMRKRIDAAIGTMSETRENQLDDLKFAAASPDNQWQWPEYALNSRGGSTGKGSVATRPCLTINHMPEHIRQVTNDQRQNRPSGKVIPANDAADAKVAEIYDGVVRHIEYLSTADVAYDTACENQVIHGEGYWRILTDYVDDMSNDQEIKLVPIRNSFSVYMDTMIQDPTGADAKWAAIGDQLTKDEYKEQYPDAAPLSSLNQMGIGDGLLGSWMTNDTVRIMEYFYVEETPTILNMYAGDGTTFENSFQDKILKKKHGKPLHSRQSKKRRVCWIKTNGYEILDRSVWPGKYIPIVLVLGNEFEVEGKIYRSGIVRNAKDAQRMYNYTASQEVEMLALSPKAPFIVYSGQIEGYEKQWANANIDNLPYLQVNSDVFDGNGAPLPLPQRVQPPMVQTGLIQAKEAAGNDIKITTGQYNASLGQSGNERSGKAILARQHEGDVGTYQYVDNLARSVRFSTRQLVDLIPKIYDARRILRIVGENGDHSTVEVDPNQQEAVKNITDDAGNLVKKVYNLGVGDYDVCVVTGPGYATKRQEALESMAQLLQGNPELWQTAGDIFVKNMDWPGADALAKRLEKAIPPELRDDSDNPALQAAQKQIQQMAQQLDDAHHMLMNVNQSVEVKEMMIKQFESQIKAFDAETRRIVATSQAMTETQMQDIALGTLHGAMHAESLIAQEGDMVNQQAIQAMQPPQMPDQGQQMPQGPSQPPQAPPELTNAPPQPQNNPQMAG